MPRLGLPVFLLVICLLPVSFSHEPRLGQDYDYSDPSTWYLRFPDCAGRLQSPIDLPSPLDHSHPSSNASFDLEESVVSGPLWEKQIPSRLAVFHNVTTFSWKVSPGLGGMRIVDESVMYFMGNMHVHTPSEHTINGERFPAELHIVHSSDPATTSGAEKEAVISVLFQRTTANDTRLNAVAETFLSQFALTGLDDGKNRPVLTNLQSFGKQLESLRWNRYRGSLTTPPCTEGVHWIVSEPVYVEQFVLDWIKADVGSSNDRPSQPKNGRTLYTAGLSLIKDYDASVLDLPSADSNTAILSEVAKGLIAAASGVVILASVAGLFIFLFSRHNRIQETTSKRRRQELTKLASNLAALEQRIHDRLESGRDDSGERQPLKFQSREPR